MSMHLLIYFLTMEDRWSYRILGEDQIEQWLCLLVEAFSAKPIPPNVSYFRSHYDNDPYRDASLIFVAIENQTGKMVSSVRIFCREILCESSVFKIAGVGEVCTLASFRNLGLSRKLLTYSLQVCVFQYVTWYKDNFCGSYFD